MAVASILIQRSFDDVAIVTPAVNPLAFISYVKLRVSKAGYLWGSIRIALIEGKAGDLKEENLGFIGKGYLIQSAADERIVLKKPRRGRILYKDIERNQETGQWEDLANRPKR